MFDNLWMLTTFDNFHNFLQFNNFDHDENDNPGDMWHTDYNYDNWEPGFMTILNTWQLRVTLDSIRTSCDVFILFFLYEGFSK